MLVPLAAAAMASAPPVPDVGFVELMRGEDSAAIAVIGDECAGDPAKQINRAIAHARRGETELARRYFQAVVDEREITELETSTGEWIDARTIARRGLAMLDQGVFASGGRFARK